FAGEVEQVDGEPVDAVRGGVGDFGFGVFREPVDPGRVRVAAEGPVAHPTAVRLVFAAFAARGEVLRLVVVDVGWLVVDADGEAGHVVREHLAGAGGHLVER